MLQSHPKSIPKVSLKHYISIPNAVWKPTDSIPEASRKHPESIPKASRKHPESIPKASRKHPESISSVRNGAVFLSQNSLSFSGLNNVFCFLDQKIDHEVSKIVVIFLWQQLRTPPWKQLAHWFNIRHYFSSRKHVQRSLVSKKLPWGTSEKMSNNWICEAVEKKRQDHSAFILIYISLKLHFFPATNSPYFIHIDPK